MNRYWLLFVLMMHQVAFGASFNLGGSVSGLGSGKSLVLLNNGADAKTITVNGSYTFPTQVATGATYSVSVAIQPSGQLCTIANATGTMGTSNKTNVNVTCANTYTVGGSITGLFASGLVLKLNNTSLIIASGATTFKFATSLKSNTSYTVSVGIQPVGLICAITNGSGVISTSNVTNVLVDCQVKYTVGGNISGLTSSGLILKLNGSSSKIIVANTTQYTFSTGLIAGNTYNVTVSTQPTGLLCLALNSSGTVSSNVTNADISCSSNIGNAILTWTKPELNDDGTPLTDLAGYKIYYGTDANNLNNVIYVNDGNILTYTIDGLTKSLTYYFAISSVNASAIEGVKSNIANKNI